MNEIFDPLLQWIGELVAAYWLWALTAIVAVGLVAVGLGQLVRLYGRWQEAGSWRKPLTLMRADLYRRKEMLLANKVLREAYEPSAQHIRSLNEGEKPGWQPALFHPYRRAVLATVKDNRSVIRGGKKKLSAYRQISELAAWISVGEVPEFTGEVGDPGEMFWIELGKSGNETDEQLKARSGIMKNALKIKSVAPYPGKNDGVISFIARVKEMEDPLVALRPGVEFFDKYPAESMMGVPLALNAKSEPWKLGMHHTLIYGTSGSGKGSPIQGLIRQQAPYVAQGLTKLFGIDPKQAEFEAYASDQNRTKMFERITMGRTEDDLREHAVTIAKVVDILDYRMKNKEVNLDRSKGKIDLGRSFTASKKNPMVLFIIDEYFALRTNFLTTLKQESKKPLGDLDTILAMGRSYGIFVIIATQYADKENLGPIRDNLGNKIVLRHEATDYITTFLLGEDALEKGHNPKAIGPSNPDNGNRTAGIGFVANEFGEIQKVRFAYLSDEDAGDFAFNFRMKEERIAQEVNTPNVRPEPQPSTPVRGRYSDLQKAQIRRSEW